MATPSAPPPRPSGTPPEEGNLPPFGHPKGGGEFLTTRPERRGLPRTGSTEFQLWWPRLGPWPSFPVKRTCSVDQQFLALPNLRTDVYAHHLYLPETLKWATD